MTAKYLLFPLTLSLLAAPLQADEVTDQIHAGLKAYENNELPQALEELNYAVAQIQEKLNSKNSVLLPEPLAGWSADEIQNTSAQMAMIGGGTNMLRNYHREEESVEINIIANSPMVSGILAMISNPMMLSSSPNMKPYRHKGAKGFIETNDGEKSISLVLQSQILIKVTGRGIKDEAPLKQYLDAMDFERIQKTFIR